MSNYRYSFSFIISSILFGLLGFSFLLLAQKVAKPKKLSMSVIKVAIISPPMVKKVIEKKTITPVVMPPVPLIHKIHKKKKPKKIIKKRSRKKRIRKKIIKKIKHKKVTKKRSRKKIIKKRVVKKRVIKKKVVKRIKHKKVEPIIEDVYIPTPQPKRVIKHVVKAPIYREVHQEAKRVVEPVIKTHVQKEVYTKPKIVDKSAEKQRFLSQVRSQIIANKKYPRMALRRHIQGSVKIKFDITSNGDVSNIKYLNGKKILQKGARRAIEKSFPITIPISLRSELPIKDIYLTIHFNINT
ncbi:TonB-like [hydrothermal vent metagenome]|uniref:TonB-like n=1 Tax=hydrothermal vent metagenome TaxID=652676 RepID=A0A1W1CBM7_9ZZZZ